MAPDTPCPARDRAVYSPPRLRETERLQFTDFSRLGNRTVTPQATTTPIVPIMVELLCALAAAALATRWLATASATLGIPSLLVGAVTALL
jgi:hypothetical protein